MHRHLRFLCLLLLAAAASTTHAAPPLDPVVRQYELANYTGVIAAAHAYLDQGGPRSPRLQSLLVRAHYELKDFPNAKIELLRFKKLHTGPAGPGVRALLQLEPEIDREVAALEKSWAARKAEAAAAALAQIENTIAREEAEVRKFAEQNRVETQELVRQKTRAPDVAAELAQRILHLRLPAEETGRLLLSNDGRFLIYQQTKRIRAWDTRDGSLVADLPQLYIPDQPGQFSPDGRYFAYQCILYGRAMHTKGRPGEVGLRTVLLDLTQGWKSRHIDEPYNSRDLGKKGGLVFSPDSQRIAFCLPDHRIVIWTVENPKRIANISKHGSQYSDYLLFSPDSRELLGSARGTTQLRFYSADRGKLLREFFFNDTFSQAFYAPDGRNLICLSSNNGIVSLSTASGTNQSVVVGNDPQYPFSHIQVSPDGKTLFFHARAADFSESLGQVFLLSSPKARVSYFNYTLGAHRFASDSRSIIGRRGEYIFRYDVTDNRWTRTGEVLLPGDKKGSNFHGETYSANTSTAAALDTFSSETEKSIYVWKIRPPATDP